MDGDRRTSAYDFSNPLTGDKADGFRFSISPEATASVLHRLADDILSGKTLITAARVTTLAQRDTFPNSVLRITFHERDPRSP
jgi:hypothetical protein